ncbi:MAG: dicarboxylate/amino acid:cation symporter [Parachlamydiaceae bacterium]|nr:dicarboxylate/amino acid:cation symporter [Parachlamydiaceae bacterium]
MKLWMKILLALVLGVIVGATLGPKAELFKPIGNLFLNLISMIIMPLVMASIVVSVTNIHDPKRLSRVGFTAFGMFLLTTLAAIMIGLAFAHFFKPGLGMSLQAAQPINALSAPGFSEIMLSLIPSNPIAAIVNGNILQVIVFSLFLGIAINYSGERGRALLEVFESLADVMYRLTSIVMEFSPIGVFALMAWVAGSFGVVVLLPLVKLLSIYYAACVFHILFVFCTILWFMARISPLPFFKGMGDAIMLAFSTCSSSATLPVSMHCLQRNLGVSKNISNFILPLGTTLNMNGAALYQVMAAMFVAQAYGIDLSWMNILILVAVSTISAIAAAGVPGSGFLMLSLVFGALGLPLEGMAILAGIDRLREMPSTVLNVLGNCVCALYIAAKEGELDGRKYNHQELVEVEGNDV